MPNKFPPRRAGEPYPPHRPTKFTEEQLADALRRAGGIHAEACRVLRHTHGTTVSVSTMGRLIASSPRLLSLKASVENARLDYVESLLWRRIEVGDLRSIMFFLRTKGAKRGYVSTVRHQGDPAKPIVTKPKFDIKGMPLEQLRRLHDILAAAQAAAAPSDRRPDGTGDA